MRYSRYKARKIKKHRRRLPPPDKHNHTFPRFPRSAARTTASLPDPRLFSLACSISSPSCSLGHSAHRMCFRPFRSLCNVLDSCPRLPSDVTPRGILKNISGPVPRPSFSPTPLSAPGLSSFHPYPIHHGLCTGTNQLLAVYRPATSAVFCLPPPAADTSRPSCISHARMHARSPLSAMPAHLPASSLIPYLRRPRKPALGKHPSVRPLLCHCLPLGVLGRAPSLTWICIVTQISAGSLYGYILLPAVWGSRHSMYYRPQKFC